MGYIKGRCSIVIYTIVILSALIGFTQFVSQNNDTDLLVQTDPSMARMAAATIENNTMGSTQLVNSITNDTNGDLVNPQNLTRKDLDPTLESLFKAREELLRKNSVSAFAALNSVSEELFRLNMSKGSVDNGATFLNLAPLHRQIEFARDSILINNLTLAINHLNAADTEFIIISEGLSQPQGPSD